jgi:hypothetical protein
MDIISLHRPLVILTGCLALAGLGCCAAADRAIGLQSLQDAMQQIIALINKK